MNEFHDPTAVHREAVAIANERTREVYGEKSVPVKLGSAAHRYWLERHDEYIEYWLGKNRA